MEDATFSLGSEIVDAGINAVRKREEIWWSDWLTALCRAGVLELKQLGIFSSSVDMLSDICNIL